MQIRHTIFWLFLGMIISVAVYLCFSQRKTDILPQRGVYVWDVKRNGISENEQNFLANNQINKLYVKFFEVEKNTTWGIHPTGKSVYELEQKYAQCQIVPTIYIRNQVFMQTKDSELDEFADNLLHLIAKRFTENMSHAQQKYTEIQIDCDWTLRTQERYFYFLKKLKARAKVQISATLRLYPFKFPEKMGVLPVDRAMLMCYNLLSPLAAGDKNSILDLEELQKYLVGAKPYPLPLDLALPIYTSALIYQNERFSGIHYLENQSFYANLRHVKNAVYSVQRDTVLNSLFLRAGDKVKIEKMTPVLLTAALKSIRKNISFEEGSTVALFHLSASNLKAFTHAEITSFFASLPR